MNEFARILYEGRDGTNVKVTYENGHTEVFCSIKQLSDHLSVSTVSVRKHLNGRSIRCVEEKMGFFKMRKIERIE